MFPGHNPQISNGLLDCPSSGLHEKGLGLPVFSVSVVRARVQGADRGQVAAENPELMSIPGGWAAAPRTRLICMPV